MICNNCGLQNPEAAVSCFQCGKPLEGDAPAQVVSPSTDGAAVVMAPTTYPEPVMPPVAPYEEPKTDGKAIASLVLGIFAILTVVILIGIVLGIPAIILGHISRSSIKKSMGKLKGAGMALAGLIMGYISLACVLVLPFILIIAAIAIPNLLKSRIAANEASAVASVRTITTATITYQTEKGGLPATLDDMQQAGMIDATLANGMKSGYRFTYEADGDHFLVVAEPVTSGSTGVRTFCAGEDAVVRRTTNEPCTIESPAI